MVAVGLLLVSAVATLSMSREREPRVLGVETAAVLSGWRFVLHKWWQTFRLVPILMIGPALIALALTTAYRNVLAAPKLTTLPTGARVWIWADSSGVPLVTTVDPSGGQGVRMATPEEVAALNVPDPWELTPAEAVS